MGPQIVNRHYDGFVHLVAHHPANLVLSSSFGHLFFLHRALGAQFALTQDRLDPCNFAAHNPLPPGCCQLPSYRLETQIEQFLVVLVNLALERLGV
jgi:hypothetical protein